MPTPTTAQMNHSDALAAIAWTLLDAEARNDPNASMLVPVFASSWNAWSDGVRAARPNAPAALDVSAHWTTAHDDAIKTALGAFVYTAAEISSGARPALIDLLRQMPTGQPISAERGVWFDSHFLPAMPGDAAALFGPVVLDFMNHGAAGTSQYAAEIAEGIPHQAPTVPNLVPRGLVVTSVNPDLRAAIAASMNAMGPASSQQPPDAPVTAPDAGSGTMLPDTVIQAPPPPTTEAFPVGAVLAIGAAAVLGLGAASYYFLKKAG